MGCVGTRNKKCFEQIMIEIDIQLKFQQLTLEMIKTVLVSFSFSFKKVYFEIKKLKVILLYKKSENHL